MNIYKLRLENVSELINLSDFSDDIEHIINVVKINNGPIIYQQLRYDYNTTTKVLNILNNLHTNIDIEIEFTPGKRFKRKEKLDNLLQ